MSAKEKIRFDSLAEVGAWNARILDEWMSQKRDQRGSTTDRTDSLKMLPLAYLRKEGGDSE